MTISNTARHLGFWPYIACLVTVFAPNGWASQSSFHQKIGANSEKQFNYSVAGAWDAPKDTFTSLGFAYSRAAVPNSQDKDTFYQLSGGVGYVGETVGVDFGLGFSQAPLTKTSAIGGYMALTYAHHRTVMRNTSTNTDPKRRRPKGDEKPELWPIFWTRVSYGGAGIRSGLAPEEENSGKQQTTALDAYFPLIPSVTLGTGGAWYRYHDPKRFFASSFRNTNNAKLDLLGATLQGLPHSSYWISAFWRIDAKDLVLPRYQITESESLRTWSHTLDFGWQHDFTRHWSATPTFELSYQGGQRYTGFMLDVRYLF